MVEYSDKILRKEEQIFDNLRVARRPALHFDLAK